MNYPERGCMSGAFFEKEELAKKVIENCRMEKGFYASTQRYHELWLRDLVYSEDVLLKLGYQKDIKNHLSELIKLQRTNGQMPTVIDFSVSKLIRQNTSYAHLTRKFCLSQECANTLNLQATSSLKKMRKL